QLAWVISFALLCSLFVALTIVPMLAAVYLGRKSAGGGWFGFLDRFAASVLDGITNIYEEVLGWSVAHRWIVVAGGAAALAGAIVLMPLVGVELQPEVDEGEVRVSVELDPGTRVQVTDDVMERMAAKVRDEVPEAEHIMVE